MRWNARDNKNAMLRSVSNGRPGLIPFLFPGITVHCWPLTFLNVLPILTPLLLVFIINIFYINSYVHSLDSFWSKKHFDVPSRKMKNKKLQLFSRHEYSGKKEGCSQSKTTRHRTGTQDRYKINKRAWFITNCHICWRVKILRDTSVILIAIKIIFFKKSQKF